jgi:amino acid adenylation domain-containing protein
LRLTEDPLIDTDLCIHQIFEARAARTPDRVAIVFDDRHLSYGELNRRANQVAHHLRKFGVGPDVFVGICVERSLDLVVGLLGILKAGGTYVPIDPQYPRERLEFMVADSRAPVLVTQEGVGDFTVPGTRVVSLDKDRPEISLESTTNLDGGVRPSNLAYVIYTSGSTGQPKGTLISHRNVVRLFAATEPWFKFDADDVWTLFHSCAFDFSVWELWGALLYGGRLVVVPFGVSRTPDRFFRLLCDEKVTVLNQTPSAFKQLMRADEAAPPHPQLSLRWVIFGGEALDFKSLKPWFDRHGDQRPRLVNMYGITETTVHVTYRPIHANDLNGGSVIGVPIPDLKIHLLDQELKPVPSGVAGEIYVGGAGVAEGYWNRPELTAQRFIPDPFAAAVDAAAVTAAAVDAAAVTAGAVTAAAVTAAAAAGARLYRSGDSARYLPNGDLEYLGRIDQQVKIRGFRIELGEIAAAIESQEAVRESVVVVRDTPAGDKILVAYLVSRPQAQVDLAALRQVLRARLPEYMIPSAFVFLERLPLTVNGKLDVKGLPEPGKPDTGKPDTGKPEPGKPGPDAPGAPLSGTALEQGIAAIWREVLDLSSVGLEQNFFDVGGNSVNLVEIHSRLQRLLERQFSITELFAHSTIRALAAHFAPPAGGSATATATPTANAAAERAQRQREALLARRNMRRQQS